MKEKMTPPQPIEDTSAMTDERFKRMLIELYNSAFWPVILKHARDNDVLAINGLASIDPVKNPTDVARLQGMRQGFYSLENEVKMVVEDSIEESNNENAEKN